jgi:hypothetical protein
MCFFQIKWLCVTTKYKLEEFLALNFRILTHFSYYPIVECSPPSFNYCRHVDLKDTIHFDYLFLIHLQVQNLWHQDDSDMQADYPHVFYMNFIVYLLTYLRIWALLEEPPIVQPLKNFPAFYGTRRLNTVFARALHWSLSWAISIQSTPSHPISLRSI